MFKVQKNGDKHTQQFHTNIFLQIFSNVKKYIRSSSLSGQAQEKNGIYSVRYVMKLRTVVCFYKILVKI